MSLYKRLDLELYININNFYIKKVSWSSWK